VTQTLGDPPAPLSRAYLLTVVGLMLVLPVASIAIERFAFASGASMMALVGKWFIFWAVGVRLGSAGVKQALQPAFTAQQIFRLSSPDANVVVRELGFANICMGLGAVVAGFVPSWRVAAGSIGGLYFGIAGLNHIIKKPQSPDEWLALVSDLLVFGVVASYLASLAG
jgi:hypothetical protein